jgi:hypothetical protein
MDVPYVAAMRGISCRQLTVPRSGRAKHSCPGGHGADQPDDILEGRRW